MPSTEKYTEYMGFEGLVIAEITEDSLTSYTPGTVEMLAPAGEIKNSTERDQATKSYDNKPYIIIKSEGSDNSELVVPVLPLTMESKILGKDHDTTTGALTDDGQPTTKYFALGYRLLCSDDTYRDVWKLKGTFTKGDEESKSKEGTDSFPAAYTYTGVPTIHKFTATGKSCKAVVVDERDGLLNYDEFFDEVVTPDTISTLVKTV